MPNNALALVQRIKHGGNLTYSNHALLRCMERGITIDQLKEVLDSDQAEVLERTPSKGRKEPDCLVLGFDQFGNAWHVVVAYTVGEIITVYQPSLPKWADPKTRGGL